MAEQKRGPIKRLKDWWDGLTYNQQLGIVVGIWTLDGFLFGTEITAAHKNKQMKQAVHIAKAEGYINGQMDAYKEMAQRNRTTKF